MNIFYGVIITGLEDMEEEEKKENLFYSVKVLEDGSFKAIALKNIGSN